MAESTIHFPGPFCEASAITEEALLGVEDLPRLCQTDDLTNGIIYELAEFRSRHNIHWSEVERWLKELCANQKLMLPSKATLRMSIERLHKRVKEMKRNKKSCLALLQQPYHIKSTVQSDEQKKQVQTHDPIAQAEPKLQTRLKSKRLPDMCEYQALQSVSKQLAQQLHETQEELEAYKLHDEGNKTQIEQKSKKLEAARKKIKRRDITIEKKETEVGPLKSQVAIKCHEAEKLSRQLNVAQMRKEMYRSRANYSVTQVNKARLDAQRIDEQLHELQQASHTSIQELEAKIKAQSVIIDKLQSENAELKEEIARLQERRVVTFEAGMYTDEVRQCCLELLSMNVGVNNVDPIIRSVLTNIAGISVERLPKYTTTVQMLTELRGIAYQQIAEKLTETKHTTLHSDATTKYGQHYGCFQISTEDTSYSLGLVEMVSGSAHCTLDTLKVILADIALVSKEQQAGSILANIKNTMSDRHIVEKSFNQLLESYRAEVLPSVVKGWQELTTQEQTQISHLNNFFCGLHLIVGMADTAATTLMEWEEVHFDKIQGAATLPGYFTKKEAGTVRFIRTACKAFEKHGSEKSGAHIAFLTLVQAHYSMKRLPLASFRGNRFNILFYDAGALYHLQSAIKEFFASGLSTDNKLLKAVEADSKVSEFWAGCRALGLVSKFVTGPLWRLLESKTPILAMNERYHHMLTCIEDWAKDASPLLSGEARLFADFPPSIDSIYDSLLKPNENDATVQEILQAIFTAFSVLLQRMVKDHLPGGAYDQPHDEMLRETKSVPKTNVVSERDFAQLDRLLREKPNASTLSLEGMIMFSNNKTGDWLRSKPEEERQKLLKTARSKAPEFRQLFQQRRQAMLEERARVQRAKKQAIAHKRAQERKQKERLTEHIIQMGLWQTIEQVEAGLQKCKSKTAKINAIKTQIGFRKKILDQTHPNKLVFQSSHQGHKFTLAEMKENLLSLLKPEARATQEQQTVPKDLIGKRISHRWLVDGEEEWFDGTVLGVVPGTTTWFNLLYDGEDQVVSLNLQKDIEDGDLLVLS